MNYDDDPDGVLAERDREADERAEHPERFAEWSQTFKRYSAADAFRDAAAWLDEAPELVTESAILINYRTEGLVRLVIYGKKNETLRVDGRK